MQATCKPRKRTKAKPKECHMQTIMQRGASGKLLMSKKANQDPQEGQREICKAKPEANKHQTPEGTLCFQELDANMRFDDCCRDGADRLLLGGAKVKNSQRGPLLPNQGFTKSAALIQKAPSKTSLESHVRATKPHPSSME